MFRWLYQAFCQHNWVQEQVTGSGNYICEKCKVNRKKYNEAFSHGADGRTVLQQRRKIIGAFLVPIVIIWITLLIVFIVVFKAKVLAGILLLLLVLAFFAWVGYMLF